MFCMAFMQMKAQSIVIQDKLVLLESIVRQCLPYSIITELTELTLKNQEYISYSVSSANYSPCTFKIGYKTGVGYGIMVETAQGHAMDFSQSTTNGVTTITNSVSGFSFLLSDVRIIPVGRSTTVGYCTFKLKFYGVPKVRISKCSLSNSSGFAANNPVDQKIGQALNMTISPNPTDSKSDVEFNFSAPTRATINIYNINGQLLQNMPNQNYEAGYNTWTINTSNLLRGIYLVELLTPNERIVQKMVKL